MAEMNRQAPNGKFWQYSDLVDVETVNLSSSAPKWVAEGFKDLMELGYTANEALKKFRHLPFFNDGWVQ